MVCLTYIKVLCINKTHRDDRYKKVVVFTVQSVETESLGLEFGVS